MRRDAGWVGRIIPRLEARRLLAGAGRFVADLTPPDALHMAVLRSPHASARLAEIDGRAARRLEGVIDLITSADLVDLPGPIPIYVPDANLQARTPYPLARERVRYVGEPVAAVLAASRALAEDALEAIAVHYAPEPAVTEAMEALRSGAPLVHPDLGTNLAARVEGGVGDPGGAFRRADHVARVRLRMGRQSPQPLEPRGVLAHWDPRVGSLTVWDSTQSAHMVRRILAYLLRLAEEQIRVIVLDVGGGFGGKNRFYPEEFLAAFLSVRHERPVQWSADRREDLLAMYQEREQVQEGELALRADGTILGMHVAFVDDAGAYTPFGLITSHMTALNAVGPYRIPNFAYRYEVVYTNKAGMAPYRGAGRPQGTFLIERLLDRAACDLGLDPTHLRLHNLITPGEQPYDTGLIRDGRRLVYDGGDYPAAYRRALEMIGYDAFSVAQAAARAEGRWLGIGTALAIEVASTHTAEGARIVVDRAGGITVYSGACSLGQGVETVLAQVCADRLGVHPGDVAVVLGDTAHMPLGGGSWASRSAVAAGNAVAAAAATLREKTLALAAALLEVSPADLDLADGEVRVRGVPARRTSLGALAEVASYPNLSSAWRWPLDRPFPWGDEQGLQATAFFRPDFTFGYAAHASIVEVDPETGAVQVLRYVVAHDCGVALNPAIVEGQVIGAVAQGIGAALFEETVYDREGQNLSATLMDYAVPRAGHVPTVAVDHLETPGPNPLGVKGAGEGGIIPVAAVVCSAVDNALAPLGVFADRIPLTPGRLWHMISAAGRGGPLLSARRLAVHDHTSTQERDDGAQA